MWKFLDDVNKQSCSRTRLPKYARVYKTSMLEQIIFFYIRRVFPDAINPYKPQWLSGGRGEIDIYIPSLRIGIEYDGKQWHKDVQKDMQKDAILSEKNVTLIRIREHGCPELESSSICIHTPKLDQDYYLLNDTIEELFKYIRTKTIMLPTIDVSIKRDRELILKQFEVYKLQHSLTRENSILASEWNYERNGGLTPDNVTANSVEKVWWKCSRGHEWQARVYARNTDSRSGTGCPYCNNRKVWLGFNDLATVAPGLVPEWLEGKNSISANQVLAGSHAKYWWKCSRCGHEWETSARERVNRKSGCPACSGSIIVAGKNDLFSSNPSLTKEWDYEKNNDIDPNTLAPNSHCKVWWKCTKCNQSFRAEVSSRNNGSGCPICAGRLIIKGYNDFATLHPDLIPEWDYSKNVQVDPTELASNSHKKAWWLCQKCGHEWEASIASRTRGQGCPACRYKKAWETRRTHK